MSSRVQLCAKQRDDAAGATPARRSSGASDSATAASNRVRVSVRVRPLIPEEAGQFRCVNVSGSSMVSVRDPRNPLELHRFDFDVAFDSDATQQAVFDSEISPCLRHVIDGINTSVFVYGATGAGKTHTMIGPSADARSLSSGDASRGIIPRAVERLLQLVQQEQQKFVQRKAQQMKKRRLSADDPSQLAREQTIGETLEEPAFECSASYLELYNEKIYDLFNMSGFDKDKDLPIREDKDKNIIVQGLTSKPFSSLHEWAALFAAGTKARSVAATKLNASSSRSHACLIITVKHKQPEPPYNWIVGKLHLIDLAGSEDNRKTGNVGQRMKESTSINSSLFVLKKVVNDLNSGKSRIPYRDSKLTRLLQDSLGGRSQAVMIANVAPTSQHFDPTYNTLTFAMKSKQVVNTPVQNLSAFASEEEKQAVESLLLGQRQRAATPAVAAHKSAPTATSGPSAQHRPPSVSKTVGTAAEAPLASSSSVHGRGDVLVSTVAASAIQQEVMKLLQPVLEPLQSLQQRLESLERKEGTQIIQDFLFSSDFESRIEKARRSTGQESEATASEALSVSTSDAGTGTGNTSTSVLDASLPVVSVELMSPSSKARTARLQLQLGKQHLKRQENVQALFYLEQALALLPNNDNLRQKVNKLRRKVAAGSGKHQETTHQAPAPATPATPAPATPASDKPSSLASSVQPRRAPLQPLQRPSTAATNIAASPSFFVFSAQHVQTAPMRPRPPATGLRKPVAPVPLPINDKENVAPNPLMGTVKPSLDLSSVMEPPRKKLMLAGGVSVAAGASAPASPSTADEGKSHQRMLLEFINRASVSELQELATIGSKRAERIVDEREKGSFASLDDLQRVGLAERGIQAFLEKNDADVVRLHSNSRIGT